MKRGPSSFSRSTNNATHRAASGVSSSAPSSARIVLSSAASHHHQLLAKVTGKGRRMSNSSGRNVAFSNSTRQGHDEEDLQKDLDQIPEHLTGSLDEIKVLQHLLMTAGTKHQRELRQVAEERDDLLQENLRLHSRCQSLERSVDSMKTEAVRAQIPPSAAGTEEGKDGAISGQGEGGARRRGGSKSKIPLPPSSWSEKKVEEDEERQPPPARDEQAAEKAKAEMKAMWKWEEEMENECRRAEERGAKSARAELKDVLKHVDFNQLLQASSPSSSQDYQEKRQELTPQGLTKEDQRRRSRGSTTTTVPNASVNGTINKTATDGEPQAMKKEEEERQRSLKFLQHILSDSDEVGEDEVDRPTCLERRWEGLLPWNEKEATGGKSGKKQQQEGGQIGGGHRKSPERRQGTEAGRRGKTEDALLKYLELYGREHHEDNEGEDEEAEEKVVILVNNGQYRGKTEALGWLEDIPRCSKQRCAFTQWQHSHYHHHSQHRQLRTQQPGGRTARSPTKTSPHHKHQPRDIQIQLMKRMVGANRIGEVLAHACRRQWAWGFHRWRCGSSPFVVEEYRPLIRSLVYSYLNHRFFDVKSRDYFVLKSKSGTGAGEGNGRGAATIRGEGGKGPMSSSSHSATASAGRLLVLVANTIFRKWQWLRVHRAFLRWRFGSLREDEFKALRDEVYTVYDRLKGYKYDNWSLKRKLIQQSSSWSSSLSASPRLAAEAARSPSIPKRQQQQQKAPFAQQQPQQQAKQDLILQEQQRQFSGRGSSSIMTQEGGGRREGKREQGSYPRRSTYEIDD